MRFFTFNLWTKAFQTKCIPRELEVSIATAIIHLLCMSAKILNGNARFSPTGVKDSLLAAILRALIKELCASVQILSVSDVCLYFHLLHTTDNANAAL